MKKKLLAAAFAIFAFSACIFLSGCGGKEQIKKDYTVRVMLSLPEGAVSISPNPVDALPGEDVSFRVALHEGVSYTGNSAGAQWTDGTLTLKNVRYPTTIKVSVGGIKDSYKVTLKYPEGVTTQDDTVSVKYKEDAGFALSFEDHVEYAGNDAGAKYSRGTLTLIGVSADTVINLRVNDLRSPNVTAVTGEGGTISGIEGRQYKYGEKINLTATPREGYRFAGWSVDGYLSNAGILVSTFENMSFELTDNTTLFANFKKAEPYTVTLVCGEGALAERDDISVEAGGDVFFSVSFKEGYVFDSCEGGVFLSGEIAVINVNSDTRVTLKAKNAGSEETHTVTLLCGAGINARAGTATVPHGADAKFYINASPGFVFSVLEGGGNYKDGIITVNNVQSDMTVTAYATTVKNYRVSLKASKGGTAYGAGEALPGTQVTLCALPRNGYVFTGWSTGGFLRDKGVMVCPEQLYSFFVSDFNIYLYANFENTSETAVIKYHLNGAKVKGAGGEVYYDTFSLEGYYYPNLMPDTGIFVRDGYTLLEYNTKEDGSGLAVNPGGKLLFFDAEKGMAEVWCVWEKWNGASDFEWKKDKDGKGVFITKYKGDAERVCVPEKLGGERVIAISSGAFTEKGFKTLILPKTLEIIEDGAFLRCPNFETLYLFDSLISATDNAFKDCRRFNNLRFNACMLPRYVNTQAWSHFRRFERLAYLSAQTEPILMFVSGSSTQYTVDSPLIETILRGQGYEYNLLNYGTNMGTCALFYMEVASNFMREGDVIVACPEYGTNQLGDAVINSTLLQGNEGAYNIFRYADMANYTNLISSVVTFDKTRLKNPKEIRYDSYYKGFDWYADIDFVRPNKSDNYILISQPISPNAAVFTQQRINRINLMYKKLSDAGIRLYYSFASMNANAITVSDEDLEKYESAMRENLDAPVISDIHTAIMEGKYFWDSNYHPGDEGSAKRSALLARDVLEQFALEKEGSK